VAVKDVKAVLVGGAQLLLEGLVLELHDLALFDGNVLEVEEAEPEVDFEAG